MKQCGAKWIENKTTKVFSLTGGSLCGNIRDNWSSTRKKKKSWKKSTYASKNVYLSWTSVSQTPEKTRVRSNLNVALSVAFE